MHETDALQAATSLMFEGQSVQAVRAFLQPYEGQPVPEGASVPLMQLIEAAIDFAAAVHGEPLPGAGR